MLPFTQVDTFQYALTFGCPYVFEEQGNNLTLASIETLEEVGMVDDYLALTQTTSYPEPIWTSGIDRLGNVQRQWASTGKAIENYPTGFQGDWSPGQGGAPAVVDYNCVAIWRYCDQQGHGATIPRCSLVPYGTWFTPRPCQEERRYICQRMI